MITQWLSKAPPQLPPTHSPNLPSWTPSTSQQTMPYSLSAEMDSLQKTVWSVILWLCVICQHHYKAVREGSLQPGHHDLDWKPLDITSAIAHCWSQPKWNRHVFVLFLPTEVIIYLQSRNLGRVMIRSIVILMSHNAVCKVIHSLISLSHLASAGYFCCIIALNNEFYFI